MTRKNISEAMNQVSNRHIEEVMNFREAKMEEEKKMKKEKKVNHKKMVWLKWKPTAAAVLALCICLSGITAFAATGALQGFFKDIFGKNGAIVGTSYEQASDEIEVTIVEVSEQLVVELVVLYPDKFPYRELEVLGIETYKIVNENNEVIQEGTRTELTEMVDGKVSISIPLDKVSNGTYKFIISEIVGGKKADQPLLLSGTWESDFIR